MKFRRLLLVLLTGFVGLVVGCTPHKEKILLEGMADIQNTVELTYEELQHKIDKKDDFVLYVYAPGCLSCEYFSPTLHDFINRTSSIIYSISFQNLGVLLPVNVTPTIFVLNDGVVFDSVNMRDDEIVFQSEINFQDYIESVAILPTMYHITVEQLREKIANRSTFIIYYSWNVCSDCAQLRSQFLDEFLKNNTSQKPLYIIEVDPWRSLKETQPEVWQAFAEEFSFDTYQGGKIPTLQYYEEGLLSSMAVYLNDVIAWNDDKTECTVTDSFYEDAPFLLRTFRGSTTLVAYQKYRDGVTAFHNQKIQEFLDCYYPLVD